MKVALIILGVIVIVCVAVEVFGNITVRRAKSRFNKMSPGERRKRQETMYRFQQMGC